MGLTLNSWQLIAYKDDITNPIRTVTDSDVFDPNKWTTFGERYCLEMTFVYTGSVTVGDTVGIDYLYTSLNGAETLASTFQNNTVNASNINSSNKLTQSYFSLSGGNLLFRFFFINRCDFNNWISVIDATPFTADFLDKNRIDNPVLFSNFLTSHYNTPKNLRFALKYESDPIEYFNIDFAGKFLAQNFNNALSDIVFIEDQLTVNGNASQTLSSSINTVVSMKFFMANGSPTDVNLQVVRINVNDSDEYLIAQSIHVNSFTSIGGNQYIATFTVNHTNIDPLNEYRLVYVVYDTNDDYFNSFPIKKFSDGTPPNPTGNFTHNWAVPNDVVSGNDTQKIRTTVNQRIGSNIYIDATIYGALNVVSVFSYLQSILIKDNQNNILRSWSQGQGVPIDLTIDFDFPDINLAFVYRVPLNWNNTTNALNWEIGFNFPWGFETWTFQAEVIVTAFTDTLAFKTLQGDAIDLICLDNLPEVIVVENSDTQALNDRQIATVETGFEWYGVRDENSENIIPNSVPTTFYQWGIFAYDDPYIFDVTRSNGTIATYKFRSGDYVRDFGLNAIQQRFFGSIIHPI
jgi:hypothetical protein